jgi:hypothetical protein
MILYISSIVFGYVLGIYGLYLFWRAKKKIVSLLGGTLALTGSVLVSLGITLIIYFQIIVPFGG